MDFSVYDEIFFNGIWVFPLDNYSQNSLADISQWCIMHTRTPTHLLWRPVVVFFHVVLFKGSSMDSVEKPTYPCCSSDCGVLPVLTGPGITKNFHYTSVIQNAQQVFHFADNTGKYTTVAQGDEVKLTLTGPFNENVIVKRAWHGYAWAMDDSTITVLGVCSDQPVNKCTFFAWVDNLNNYDGHWDFEIIYFYCAARKCIDLVDTVQYCERAVYYCTLLEAALTRNYPTQTRNSDRIK